MAVALRHTCTISLQVGQDGEGANEQTTKASGDTGVEIMSGTIAPGTEEDKETEAVAAQGVGNVKVRMISGTLIVAEN